MAVPVTDRLIRLSMTRAALRHYQLDSADAWHAATPEQRAHLEPEQRALVDRAIRDGQADVLAALWSPVEWHAAELLTGRSDRLLVVDGREADRYRADDPEGARRAARVGCHPGGDAAVRTSLVAGTLAAAGWGRVG